MALVDHRRLPATEQVPPPTTRIVAVAIPATARAAFGVPVTDRTCGLASRAKMANALACAARFVIEPTTGQACACAAHCGNREEAFVGCCDWFGTRV